MLHTEGWWGASGFRIFRTVLSCFPINLLVPLFVLFLASCHHFCLFWMKSWLHLNVLFFFSFLIFAFFGPKQGDKNSVGFVWYLTDGGVRLIEYRNCEGDGDEGLLFFNFSPQLFF